MQPLVSVITVNYNQTAYTLELLASLQRSRYANLEVIVVDNASRENPEQAIRQQFPSTKVVISSSNLGFAGGNNLGIREASGKYLFFLNNDTEIDPDAITPLVELFESTPNAGAASPKILYHNSGDVIQYVGSEKVNPYTGRNRREGFRERDNGQYDRQRITDLAHGAAMMVPRTIIEKVGPMPELFFLYYEELDWCESIKRAGFTIWVVPESRVYHKESMSIGKNSTLKTYYMTRNRLLFMRRNTNGLEKLSWILFFIFFSFPKNTITYALQGYGHLSAFWRGLLWNLGHGPDESVSTTKSPQQ